MSQPSALSTALRKIARTISLSVALIALLAVFTPPAYAEPYGRGGYSTCQYQLCPAATEETPTTTVVETKSGLDVAINLQDGQNIPRSGYVIYVTPLNGQGQSFQKAEFYIDGTLVYTSTPDTAGEVQWKWNPNQHPGTTIKITIYSTDGSTITKTFTVHITDDVITASGTTTPTPVEKHDFISNLERAIDNGTQDIQSFIRTLPAPIVYAFPYILFILLGVGILLVFLQQKRELSEAATLRRFAEHQRQIVSAKGAFVQLSSHYLRTPLAIIDGGVEILRIRSQGNQNGPTGTPNTSLEALRQALQHLKQPIEKLLDIPTKLNATEPVLSTQTRIWTRVAFWLPLVLVGSLTLAFVYLADRADALNPSLVSWLSQIMIFMLLALLLYQVMRHLYLRRADRAKAAALSDEETRLSDAQDQFVGNGVAELQAASHDLEQLVLSLPKTAETKVIHNGYNQFVAVLHKLTIASQVRNTTSNEPFERVALSQLITQAVTANATIAANQERVSLADDALIDVRQPKLLALVLESIVDNAIAYSPENGKIDIDTKTDKQQLTITVRDHGHGIPAEKLNILFRPFGRIEDATHFDREGMGFSLYLDRLIMEHLGGDITATSESEQGTTISLTLPPKPLS